MIKDNEGYSPIFYAYTKEVFVLVQSRMPAAEQGDHKQETSGLFLSDERPSPEPTLADSKPAEFPREDVADCKPCDTAEVKSEEPPKLLASKEQFQLLGDLPSLLPDNKKRQRPAQKKSTKYNDPTQSSSLKKKFSSGSSPSKIEAEKISEEMTSTFKCALTKKVMKDPVRSPSGHVSGPCISLLRSFRLISAVNFPGVRPTRYRRVV